MKMITNKSYDIDKYQKWLSQAESSVATAQQEFDTAKQKLDSCIADRDHVQSALSDQKRAEDLVMSIVGNVSSDATLDGVSISKQANNNVDHCKAYFTASSEFVNELVNKLSAEEIKPGVYRGSYNGCSFRITSDGSDVYLTIQNFSTLFSETSTNESVDTEDNITESISEQQIASVLADARDQADEFGVTEEFTFEYYIGNAVSAAGYPSSKLFMFLNDHVSETDKEYRDALRGWKENEGIDSSAEDNFIPDDDM